MSTTFRITIARKPGLSDPEGTTTLKALNDLGFSEVSSVTFGKTLTVKVASDDPGAATAEIEKMCAQLLANPVIETYTIEAVS